MDDTNNTQTSYDRVAGEYAKKFVDELAHKPLDRELLDRFASRMIGKGRVCDLGCGPGQIAHYLHQQGVNVFGVDLSSGMVEVARQTYPQIEFQQSDMSALDFPDDTLAGMTAFYCIIHIERDKVTDVLKELRRVLQPGGLLLMSFHRGDEVVHLEEWWGENVLLDFTFFQREEMELYLQDAGFQIDEVIERAPYPEEHPSHRVYIFASKP